MEPYIIAEGIPTILIAPLAWIYLPKGPGECRFLNKSDNEIVRLRAVHGRGIEENGKLNFKQVFAAFYDYKNYLQAVIVFCLNVSFFQSNFPCFFFSDPAFHRVHLLPFLHFFRLSSKRLVIRQSRLRDSLRRRISAHTLSVFSCRSYLIE